MLVPDPSLMAFFPQKTGAKWTYMGMAEYDHRMTLNKITKSPLQLIYKISGKVGDPSGGATKRKLDFRLEYQFTKKAVYEKIIEADTPFPHRIKNLKLLALPITKGATWRQTVMINSKPAMIKAEILEKKIDPKYKREMVRVRYRVPMAGMPNNTYEEIREFVKGIGVTHFEKTFGPQTHERFNYNLSKFEVPGQPVQTF